MDRLVPRSSLPPCTTSPMWRGKPFSTLNVSILLSVHILSFREGFNEPNTETFVILTSGTTVDRLLFTPSRPDEHDSLPPVVMVFAELTRIPLLQKHMPTDSMIHAIPRGAPCYLYELPRAWYVPPLRGFSQSGTCVPSRARATMESTPPEIFSSLSSLMGLLFQLVFLHLCHGREPPFVRLN
jgi:hypothetical protein